MQSTYITYYVETNLICFLFVSFVLYSYIRESRGLSEAKWFVSALVTVQVYCAADICAAVFKNQTFTGARTILWIANTIYIMIPLALVIFWHRYITEHMRALYRPGRVFRFLDKLMPILSLAVCAACISTPVTHSIFYLDELNSYHRTFGAYAVPVYAYVFMIYETVKLQIIRKNSDTLQIKRDADILSWFAVPCICFSLVQVVLYGTTVSQVGFTMALMIVFIGRQRNKISRDELTGLNNRREYEYAIDRLSRNSGHAMIVMIDVNDFKSINDTYGHTEGDNALKAVAMILRKSCSNRKYIGSLALYRYGGDEFIMVSTESSFEEQKRALLEAIAEETDKWNAGSGKDYTISLSVGVVGGSYFGKDIFALVDDADKEMYSVKAQRKKQKNAG